MANANKTFYDIAMDMAKSVPQQRYDAVRTLQENYSIKNPTDALAVIKKMERRIYQLETVNTPRMLTGIPELRLRPADSGDLKAFAEFFAPTHSNNKKLLLL